MSQFNLTTQLTDYQTQLQRLQNPDPTALPTKTDIYNLLLQRDNLHRYLQHADRVNPSDLLKLRELDEQLKQSGDAIAQILPPDKLADWRQEMPYHSDQWWWHLEKYTSPHPRDQLDWLWRSGAVVGWVLNLSLAVALSTRLFVSGAGVPGAITVISSSLLAFVQNRTETRDRVNKAVLQRVLNRVPSHWQAEAQCGVSVGVLGLLLLMWMGGLPLMSRIYSVRGLLQQEHGNYQTAEQSYQKAIAINPNNARAHYNLGTLYEDLNDLEQAKAAYQVAARSPDFPRAYNNLSRLYLLEEDYRSAAPLLHEGLLSLPSQVGHTEDVEYALNKNLGWLEQKQDNHDAARTYLNRALRIAQTRDLNPSSSHCLLAQLPPDPENPDPQASLEHWLQCCQQEINEAQPEEYEWLELARQRLAQENQECFARKPPVSP